MLGRSAVGSLQGPSSAGGLHALVADVQSRRLRRRLRGAAVITLLAAGAFGLYALTVGEGAIGPRQCRASALRMAVSGFGGTAGTSISRLTFTNVSSKSCSVFGWPSFRLVKVNGRSISVRAHYPVTTDPSIFRPRRFVLPPGGVARAYVFDGTLGLNCTGSARRFAVVPPGVHASVRQTVLLPYCGPGSFAATPLVAGPGKPHAF